MSNARQNYTMILRDAGSRMTKLRRERSPEVCSEVYEAWITAGLAGLIEIHGWANTWNLLCTKMGQHPAPHSKPKLVVDNTPPEPDFAA